MQDLQIRQYNTLCLCLCVCEAAALQQRCSLAAARSEPVLLPKLRAPAPPARGEAAPPAPELRLPPIVRHQ